MPLRHYLTDLAISGSDGDTSAVQALACKLIFAVVLSSYFQFLVSTVTGGVFSAQGRNQVATALSFGFELPFSIGAAAVLIFVLKTSLEWVYWGAAVVAAVEACIVLLLLCGSDWSRYSREARERQEQAQDAASNSEEVLAASDDV
jgi:Na+-driven multidrug efflux pump